MTNTNRVLVKHFYCQQVSDVPAVDGVPQISPNFGRCEYCGQGWEHGYSILGPVTLEYLASRADAEATSAALRLASDLGIELSDVAGTGAGGEVTADDVERAYMARLDAPTPEAIAEEIVDESALIAVVGNLVAEAIARHEQRWHVIEPGAQLGPDGAGGSDNATD